MISSPAVNDARRPSIATCAELPQYHAVGPARTRWTLLAACATLARVWPEARALDDAETPVTMSEPNLDHATFAGGCFWCMEPPFDKLDGVISTTSGYTGGHMKDPSYEDVTSGTSGHAEAIRIVFDPAKVGYATLLDTFWRNIDPTTANRQFCDVGSQYRTAIFYHDEEQKRLAEASKKALEESRRFGGPIVTEIVAASDFYVAEEYHQDYYRKNPVHYRLYRLGCGRDQILEELWGNDPT
jgi:peptide-methionine (S)-S-oxide reductase